MALSINERNGLSSMSDPCSVIPTVCFACCAFRGCDVNLPPSNENSCFHASVPSACLSSLQCAVRQYRDLMPQCCPASGVSSPPELPPYPPGFAPKPPPPQPPAPPSPPPRCPAVGMDPSWMTWGLRLYCPAGTGVPQSCRDNINECENIVCQAGYLCPTPDTRIECPPGYYCKNGVNSTTRCDLCSCSAQSTRLRTSHRYGLALA